ncbi:uncharacterized protein EDB91DRAFT_550753 [Suillus paluster]|uniref:uncharacterized protein n=1 Tax=Suillus paluster TaxID=48578 RepID=UPI001B87ADBF|nr:uncharacterized protein EDB91DRAFT_550753 [Suillus paluster]KAG1735705.1 hypothetical protein EDB91DRAFT_550753 [Suillus paluster]
MPLSISSSKLKSSLHLHGAPGSSIFGSGGGSSDSNPHVDTTSSATEPPAPEQDDTEVQSPSAVPFTSPPTVSPTSPTLSSYQQPLSDEARAKKQQELFDSIIDDKLGTIPLRLIDTTSGKLCSTGEFYAHLKESHAYKEVEVKILRASEREMKAIVDTFFEFAMFSHRWGAADDEPTYQHVKDALSIYDMTAPAEIVKLQKFCMTARDNQFRWAWSDTCCIDKTNNVELQESIISMFSWYRLSSGTIVYLSDVTDEESFRHSVWFTRGWTLQELIAPRLVWFYKKDWTPYIDSKQNHKEDPQVVKIISQTTSIDRNVLNHFVPGLRDVGPDEVKKRMGWLASRRTAKIEDMAYCMMGIFGVHMPVMYGEKKHAFVRLQKEIMNLTEDLSLFDWVGEPSDLHSYFASHPRCFAKSAAECRRGSSKLPHIKLYKMSRDLTTGLTASVIRNVKNLLHDPPHGHFIANGKMNMQFFVHEVTTLTPVEMTDPTTHGLGYHVKAKGLAEMTITTHRLLPDITDEEDSPSYRLVRMWEVGLIPPADAAEIVDAEAEDDECPEASGKPPSWLGRSKSMLSDSLDAVATAVSHNSVVMFLSYLQEPFVAQLLMKRKHGGPYERVGTTERLIAKPSLGSVHFRGIKTLIVR